MRKTLFLLFFAAAILPAAAQSTGTDDFVCVLNNGTTVAWKLNEQPKVELQDGMFAVSSTRATVYYPAGEVERFELKDGATEIISVAKTQEDATSAFSYLSSGKLIVRGCKPGETASVYSTDGKEAVRCVADEEGCLLIEPDALPKGVYIVKSRSINLKIAKK